MLADIVALEAVLAIVVWVGASVRWRLHWYDGRFVGSLFWLLTVAGVVGFSSRSFLPTEIADLIASVVRGLYVVVGAAVWWAGPPPKEPTDE